MIYKYENQDQIPSQLLCFVCVSICENQLQCNNCDQLICHKCTQQSECYNCKDVNYQPIQCLINYFVEMVQCKCQYCSKYIKYLKYRSHINRCQIINNDLSNTFLILEKSQDDNNLSEFNQKSITNQYVDSKISIEELKTQQGEIKNNDLLKNNIKIIYKYCNIIIQFVDAKLHYKQCLEINKVDQLQCDSVLFNDDFFSLYKYQLKSGTQKSRELSHILFQSFKLQGDSYMNEFDKQRINFQQKKLWQNKNYKFT